MSATPPTSPPEEAGDRPADAKKTDRQASLNEALRVSSTTRAEGGADGFKKLTAAAESLDLPPEQKKVLMKVKEYQEAHLRLEVAYRYEWNELKLKYLEQFQPLYQSRRQALVEDSAAEEVKAAEDQQQQTGTKNLPEFWVKAMKNHLLLAEMIEDHDVPILSHLQDIAFEWVNPKEQTSFKLDFFFSPNDYFENKVLSKVYHLERTEDDDEESVLTKTEGTKIEWKSGKNVTERKITRKQRNKRTNQTRTITETVEDNSFFNFFQSHEIPSEELLEAMDEREVAELEMVVEAEFEVGCILRDKIIPRAVGWFLGIEKDEDAESEGNTAAAEGDYDSESEDDSENED